MIVLVDLDGVTADLEGQFWEIFADWYPEAPQIAPEDRRTFYIEEQIGQEWTNQVHNIIHARGFYASLQPIPGALDGIYGLQAQGHQVTICTSPVTSPWCASEKIDWVRRHLGQGMATNMIISKDKTLIHGDVLFDDRPSVTGCRTPEWEHVLCSQPYNMSISGRLRATWDTLPKLLGDL